MIWFSLLVLLPLTAIVVTAGTDGWSSYVDVLRNDQTWAAVALTVQQALLVTGVNIVFGTVIAWVLVRDRFWGKSVLDVIIDVPFALPTIVAGLTLLALYRDVAFTRWAVFLALLFVTLPFVVRTVQPVLLELDPEMEDAAASLGASRVATFRRIIFPNILPAILSGVALAFARAVGEFGAVVLLSGNLPFKTEVASVYVFGRIESGDEGGAAAASVVILAVSFGILLAIGGVRRWATRHDR